MIVEQAQMCSPRSLKSALRQARQSATEMLRGSPIPARWCGPAKRVVAQTTEAVRQSVDRRPGSAWIVEVDPPSHVRRALPRTIDARPHWQFCPRLEEEIPGSFVAGFSPGQVVGSEAAVFTAAGDLVWEACREVHRPASSHKALRRVFYARPRLVRGSVGVLAVVGGANYYHFLLEAIPRLGIIQRANLKPAERLVINQLSVPAVCRDILAAVLPADSRWIRCSEQTSLWCERLLVPCTRALSGSVPPEAFEYVRKSFLPMESSNRELPRRVYIDRRDASYRRIANGDEVERALARRGIVPMQLERLTFAEQVALFHRAEMIVAPHGAGLSNAVFCSPACRVLELFSPGYVNPVFWALSSLGQLVYAYLLGSGDSPPDGIDPHRVGDDIHVPVERLNNALDLLES